jgi:hypothetical protein
MEKAFVWGNNYRHWYLELDSRSSCSQAFLEFCSTVFSFKKKKKKEWEVGGALAQG